MTPSERAQFALALGLELPQTDFPIVDPSLDVRDLLTLIDRGPEHSIERFALFLERNPRAIRTLDPDSIRAILLPVITARQAEVQGTDDLDIPYTHELVTALANTLPRISLKDARLTLGRCTRAIAFPFVVTGRTCARGARALFSLPARIGAALLALGGGIARSCKRAAHGTAIALRFIASISRRTIVSLVALLRSIARYLVVLAWRAARASLDAVQSIFRRFTASLAALARLAAGSFAQLLRFTGRSFAALARNAARALRHIASIAALGGSAVLLSIGRVGRGCVLLARRSCAAAAAVLRFCARSCAHVAKIDVARPVAIAACFLLAALLASSVLPPAIRYAHERSFAFGRASQVRVAANSPQRRTTGPVSSQVQKPRRAAHASRKQVPRIKRVTVKAPVSIAAVPSRPLRHSHWKFDPVRNPFMNDAKIAQIRRPEIAPARVASTVTTPPPSNQPQLVQRARSIVTSYLASLIRGDASSALGNLGLSASAPTSNLSEGPLLSRAAVFRIVDSAMREGGQSAKVDVEISSPQGRYFGVYTVEENGTAAWITDHTVIPAGSDVAAHR
ncbi:MAG: hypothetical protein ABI282_11335 [Candidatus Baltobacteraceae bacterium]